jgi:hypothetical protein
LFSDPQARSRAESTTLNDHAKLCHFVMQSWMPEDTMYETCLVKWDETMANQVR